MNNKDKFGEVFTPPSFVQQMINDSYNCGISFENIKNVFEPGAGKGVFLTFLLMKIIVFLQISNILQMK